MIIHLLLLTTMTIFHVLDNSRHDVVNDSATHKPRDYEPPVTPPTHLLRPKMIGSKITKSKLNRVRLTTRRPKPAAAPTTPSVPQVMDASFFLFASWVAPMIGTNLYLWSDFSVFLLTPCLFLLKSFLAFSFEFMESVFKGIFGTRKKYLKF